MAAIRSLQKHTPEAKVTVFDNSDRTPLKIENGEVIIENYIDNTKGQVVDWGRWLAQFHRKLKTHNDWGSAKHCWSVELCIDMFPDGFLLMDSDVLVKQDVTPFFDTRYAWSGQARHGYRTGRPGPMRVEPFLCFINTPMIRQHGIHYCDTGRIVYLTDKEPERYYDTGASFWEDCTKNRLPGKEMVLNDYILHLGSASWKDRPVKVWLDEHGGLWK